jgi:transcriptional regulator with XRE-family HTH domain
MSDGVDVVVGRRVKARRRLMGFTQQQLAEACGVTFQQIQKYECAACRLSANMLWKVACALDVEISYFFSGLTRESNTHGTRCLSDLDLSRRGASPGL